LLHSLFLNCQVIVPGIRWAVSKQKILFYVIDSQETFIRSSNFLILPFCHPKIAILLTINLSTFPPNKFISVLLP
jgi:hypothetical protein